MNFSAKELDIASQINARIGELERSGANELTIFVEMTDRMSDFKFLLDTVGQLEMDELCIRFDGFYRYAKILENIASGIQSGEIVVP